ncbi:MAG: TonB-dependent receptor [Azonexus sp.]
MLIRALRCFSFAWPAAGSGNAPAMSPQSAGGPASRQEIRHRMAAKPDSRRWAPRLLALLIPAAFALSAQAEGNSVSDIIDTPFEQLLKTDVITAEKLAKQISDAPSAVSIVTAQDIKDFGYRSLSDILDSMRGLSMAHDGQYGYLSGRGYGNAGNYAGRFTLLIDGYRATDNFFGQAYFGADGLLDVELIERVEYIPGSGSSSYGDSAFLGVINVVTKKGSDIDGTQVSTEFGSRGWRRNRVSFGRHFDSGLDLVVAASGIFSNGRELRPVESPGLSDIANGTFEKDRNKRFFLKAAYQGWTFEGATSERSTRLTGQFGLETDTETSSFARLRYDAEIAANTKTSIDVYYGHFGYKQDAPEGSSLWLAGGEWRGVDAKLVGTSLNGHTMVLGTEWRDDYSQWSRYSNPYYTDEYAAKRQTTSIYLYDDISLADRLKLNIGGRWDKRNDRQATFSPRGALVWLPIDGTTLKFSAGQAHRQQTAGMEGNLKNPDGIQAKGERATTRELVWEQMFGPKTRLITSLFRYRLDDFLFGSHYDGTVGYYVPDSGTMRSKGAEIELEHVWNNGMRLRTSYTSQDTRDDQGQLPVNLARNIGKINLSAPVIDEHLRAGLSIRYLGRRLNVNREYEPPAWVADLTLSSHWNNWSASFSARNLGNTHYNEVGGAFYITSGAYPADRRNFWFQLGYEFK